MIKLFPLILFITLPLWGGNPFLTKTTQKPATTTEHTTIESPQKSITPAFWVRGKRQLFKWQYQLRKKLSKFAKTIKKSPSPSIFLLSFLMAFLYGLVHALGPGHGKIFAISYFLSRRSTLKKGILLGSGIAFFHMLSGVVLVGVIYFIVKVSLATTTNRAELFMQPISYGAITLLGVVLLVSHIRKMIQKVPENEIKYTEQDNRSLLGMSIAVGMVPCPATMFVLLFSIAINLIWFGLYLVIAIALGMGVTISLVGIMTIYLHNRGKTAQQHTPGKSHAIIELIGASMIILIGSFLLLTTFI